ncbi:hypothetical protein PENSPDRAFT_688409 [Peniophora sp. CONT]|nr:hypothetical protein PENSPDRAFT_688409 [Peniophora sp. CONT]
MSDPERPAQTAEELKGDEDEPNHHSGPSITQDPPVADFHALIRLPNPDSRYTPPVLKALSVTDIVLVIVFHVKDNLGWDFYFLRESFDARSQYCILCVVRSFLALRFVNRAWNHAISGLRTLWSVIPASMTMRDRSMRGCLWQARGTQPLAITMSAMPDKDYRELLDHRIFARRLVTIRLLCETPTEFYEGVLPHRVPDERYQLFIDGVENLTVCAKQINPKTHFWLRAPPPQLTTLRLTNFEFTKSCTLPPALRELTLAFTPPPWRLPDGEVWKISMHLADLMGVLSRLASLEVLCVDLRYMPAVPLSQVGKAKFPALKRLTVRSATSGVFCTFVSSISCPSLERAYLSIDLSPADSTRPDHTLSIASGLLARLVLKGSHPSPDQPNRFDIGHVYLDDRANPLSEANGKVQATVALGAREDFVSFVDNKFLANCLASTAVCVLTVTRPLAVNHNPTQQRDMSSILGLILEGLPNMDLDTLTVHSRPGRINGPDDDPDCVWVFPDTSFLQHVGSVRHLNWLADSKQLGLALREPNAFPRLEYLALALPKIGGYSVELHDAVDERKDRARDALIAQGLPNEVIRKQLRLTWRAPVMSSDAHSRVSLMFKCLLDAVGTRVI